MSLLKGTLYCYNIPFQEYTEVYMIDILEIIREEGFAIVLQAAHNVPRALKFAANEKFIHVAIGMRRAGKSSFLYQTINELLVSGVSKDQILMINFEDDRLLPMKAKEMGELLDAFYVHYPENHNRRCYLFLDEVQNVEDWQWVIRRYYDSKNVQLYLTGSSAKLLSTEIATSLRGRSLSMEVWPYSFKEYLLAHKLDFPERPFGQRSQDIFRKYLFEYFSRGGFPGVQHLPDKEWRETLQGYVDTVVLRDIVERHNVVNVKLLQYLTTTLLKNAASPFSINKFYNDVKSQGFNISKNTLHHYLNYLEDTFLIAAVPFYSESLRVGQNQPKKIYAVDNGLINANSFSIKPLQNKFFENQVYLDLRRQNKEIYFYKTKDNYEIDFVTVDKEGRRELIQVCLDASDPKTEAREKRALQQAEQELGIQGRILTLKEYFIDLL